MFATARKDEDWPPKSAQQALMSSPSGRKKYANIKAGDVPSPIKGISSTPGLLDRMRLIKRNKDRATSDEDEEEDEETLRLKLAAIEAKLKLKKLQNKAKRDDQQLKENVLSGYTEPLVEVSLSPVRRTMPSFEPRSPSRILLGIDKGVKGADISLRRARTVGSPSRDRNRQEVTSSNRHSSRASSTEKSRKMTPQPNVGIKSFSERMTELRGNDKKGSDKHSDLVKARSRNFKVSAAEMEQFRAAAEEVQSHSGPRSPIKDLSESAKITDRRQQQQITATVGVTSNLQGSAEEHQGDANLFEGFSGLHLSSRILPHSFLKRTLPSDQFKIYKIPDLLKNITSPAYEMPDDVIDFVVFGTIASKSSPLDQKSRADALTKGPNDWERKWDDGSQNRKKFMALTLTDLKWTIDVYLFDTALPRYHRLTPGTVIAILNPSIMPPRRGKEDTGAFSLALHDGDDTVLEIGVSKHLGFCNVVKKDGKECSQWVNAAKSEICEWHLNAQIAKTQSKRMGVNTGTNGFGARQKDQGQRGGHGHHPTKTGRGFDSESGSHYYMASSNLGSRVAPIYNPDISTARMLDMDDNGFIAEGQFQRDKEAILQKRLANAEKERQIARKLADLGSGSSAGANYMRRRAENDTSLKPGRNDIRQHPTQAFISPSPYPETGGSRSATQTLKTEIGRKRAAEDVRLSPIKKKTRFLTDRGIKVAGRESMGINGSNIRQRHDSNNDDDDDDDLDIV